MVDLRINAFQCDQLHLVGTVSNSADAVRLETVTPSKVSIYF